MSYIRKSANMKAEELLAAVLLIYESEQKLAEVFSALNGKVSVTYMDRLLLQRRKLMVLAITLEDDYLRLTSNWRQAPLLGNVEACREAIAWVKANG